MNFLVPDETILPWTEFRIRLDGKKQESGDRKVVFNQK